MHTVDLLEEAVATAIRLGYKLRQDWLGGGGGGCEIKGQKWLFLDLALSPSDQLAQVVDTLGREPRLDTASLSPTLARLLTRKKSA